MKDIKLFLEKISQIKWFYKEGLPSEKYHIIHSFYEAYDIWNSQMLQVWEPEISSLEEKAQNVLGDEMIDKVFELVVEEIQDDLWNAYCTYVEKRNLTDEAGLESEIMDCIKRDVAWAGVEYMLGEKGFFRKLLEIYEEGYFPCSWQGEHPEGMFVVM